MCDEVLVMTVAKRQLGAWVLELDFPDLPPFCVIVVGLKLVHN